MKQTQKPWVKAVSIGSTISTTLACTVGGGYLLGRYLKDLWHTGPWLEIVLIFAGLIMGGVSVVSTLKSFLEEKEGSK